MKWPPVRGPSCQHHPALLGSQTKRSVIAEDPDREPYRVRRVADQEHGAEANVRRQRREHVVDLEVTVGRQQDAGRGRNPFGKGCSGFTDQGSEHGTAKRSRCR